MNAPATTLVTVTLNPAIDLSCTVADFTPGQVNRVSASQSDAGGKGVNIARLLRQFALPVTATGFLGEANPHLFQKLFSASGINDAFVRVPGETRTGIKILDPLSQETTDINFPGFSPTTDHLQELRNVLERLAATAATVIIAGSVPGAMEPATIAQLVQTVKAQGVPVYVDTSGPALQQAIGAGPTLIKPNQEELSAYLGRPLTTQREIVAEARRLIDQGITTIVVSLGAEGALFVQHDQAYMAVPPRVKAISTVGAGDAMVGSLAAGFQKGLSLSDCARLATAVSAAVVTEAGPGLASLAAAKAIEDQVEIHRLTF